MITTKWILAAAAMTTATPALATDDVRFSIDGVDLTAPVPPGYCLPEGSAEIAAKAQAAADDRNLTLARFGRCDDAGLVDRIDYMYIKSPRSALATRISRKDYLAAAAKEFGRIDWPSTNDQVFDEVGKKLSKQHNAPVATEGSIRPRGTDDVCAYLGGSLSLAAPSGARQLTMGACITSAGGKIVAVYAYGDPDMPGGVEGLMRKARTVALSIEPAR